jgi:iron complex transport system permease protein
MNNQTRKRQIPVFLILTILFFSVFIIDIFIGSVTIPFKEVLKAIFTQETSRPEWLDIINNFRMPKALTAICAGAALSISGLQMQTVFRNPLAGPDVLGISSGASLGVALVVLGTTKLFSLELINFFGNWTIVSAACIGSGLILLLISAISMRVRDVVTILILGILFSSVTLAIVSILQYFSPESTLKSFMIWTMGSLGGITKSQLFVLIPCVLFGIFTAVLSAKSLNALQLGEHYAQSMGVHIKRSRFFIFLSTSILAGSVTAFCGPLGFIGIAVPHIVKLVFKTTNHNILIPGCILTGAITLLASDIISNLPGSESAMPINAVTSLIGIPFVVWIIIKNKKIA